MLSAIICFGLTFAPFVRMLCPESISTVSVVSHCPSSATEWVSAAKRKSCNDLGKVQNCTKPDKFVYHCVLNKEATQLLEVCAPVWFMSGYCARFSEVDKRIINDPGLDCTKIDPPCPSRFPSNESYKYQTCYRSAILNNHIQTGAADFIRIVLLGIIALLVLIMLILLFVGLKLKRYECSRCCGKKRKNKDILSSEGKGLLDPTNTIETKYIEEVSKSNFKAKKRISYRNLSGNIKGSCSLKGIKTICDLRGKLSRKLGIPKDILFVVYEEKGILFDDDTEIKTLKVFPIELMIGNQNRMNDVNIADSDEDDGDDMERDVLSNETFASQKYKMDCGHSTSADSLLAWTKDRLFHHTDVDLFCPECSSLWDMDKISEICKLSSDEKQFFKHVKSINKCNKTVADVLEYEINKNSEIM